VRTKIEERIHDITLHHCQQSPPVKGANSGDYNDEQSTNACSLTKDIIIVEAAILLETDWHDLMDGLWVVQSSEDVAKSRLIQNRGMTEEEALLRIRAQQKRKGIVVANDGDGEAAGLREAMENGIVTAIITNDGSLEDLEKALKEALADPTSFKTTTKKEGTG
jgi:dephospho-CoA kinase